MDLKIRFEIMMIREIISYGIITYCIYNGTPLFLLHQKRDTFAYVEFIRGLWRDEIQIPILLTHMTVEERSRLLRYTFKELWDDLWINHSIYMYSEGYIKAHKKFKYIISSIPIYLLNTISVLEEPFWAFPKGRKEEDETILECAKREFTEESCLSHHKILLHNNISVHERFFGFNNKIFSTVYFIGRYPEPELPPRIIIHNMLRSSTISNEAYDLKWMNYDEAIEHLEPFRQRVLYDANREILKNLNTPYFFSHIEQNNRCVRIGTYNLPRSRK